MAGIAQLTRPIPDLVHESFHHSVTRKIPINHNFIKLILSVRVCPPCFFSFLPNQLFQDEINARENKGTEREAPGPGLGVCQFHCPLIFS